MKFRSFYICSLLLLCLFITGCVGEKTKVVASLDKFNNIVVNKGFTVVDNTSSYNDVNYILNSRVAVYEDIEIEMIEYNNGENASIVQQGHIESFNLLKSTGAHAKKDKGSNYYSYVLVSNNRYMVSTRVDNTLIFCKVMLNDKDIVEDILTELGYN